VSSDSQVTAMAMTDFLGIFLIWAFVTVMVLMPTTVKYIKEKWDDIKAGFKKARDNTRRVSLGLSHKAIDIAKGKATFDARVLSPHLLRRKKREALENAFMEMSDILQDRAIDLDDGNSMLREVIRRLAVLEKDVFLGFERAKPPPVRVTDIAVEQGDGTRGAGMEEGKKPVQVAAVVVPGDGAAAKEEKKAAETNATTTSAFEAGTRVIHPSRGWGLVTENMPDGRTRVKFDLGDEHRYKPDGMLKFNRASATKS